MKISILTVTYNRGSYLRLLERCICRQTYDHSQIEWVILDDSDSNIYIPPKDLDGIKVRYIRLKEKYPLGQKRNLGNRECNGQYILVMDDDDYYSPDRVKQCLLHMKTGSMNTFPRLFINGRHLMNNIAPYRCELAGSTYLFMYFVKTGEIWRFGAYGNVHATCATMAYTKDYARNHFFKDDVYGEEREFCNKWSEKMAQINAYTMLSFSHSYNTVDKTIFLDYSQEHKSILHKTDLTLEDFIDDPIIVKFWKNQSYIYQNSHINDKVRKIIKKQIGKHD